MPDYFSIAGIGFAIALPEPFASAIFSHLNLFRSNCFNQKIAEFVVDVGSDLATVDVAQYKTDVTFRGDGEHLFTLENSLFSMTVSPVAMKAHLHIPHSGSHVPAVVFSGLKWFVIYMVVMSGSLPLHSSMVSDGEEGFVFCGQSGKGKSTIHSLLTSTDEFAAGSDEINVLSVEHNQVIVYPTPFKSTGNSASFSDAIPVKNVFFIEHANGHRVDFFDRKKSMGYLLKNTICFRGNKIISEAIMDAAVKFSLFDLFACLHFRNDASIAGFVKGKKGFDCAVYG